MRLIVAVYVLGENMVVHGKDVLVVLRFVVGGILKEHFVEGGVVNFKEQGFKDF